ncbi:MAG: MOSC domain-containing protein [Devosiaceae bacterium]|nr:MOSC domain-containing protein [Devosiaceae bacterium MH13]
MSTPSAVVTTLWRWPVKGLGGETLASVAVKAGGLFPYDRAFALENGPSDFDAAAPVHVSKRHFVCMVHQPHTGRMTARYDEAAGRLRIASLDGRSLDIDPSDPGSLEALAAELVDEGVRGPLRLRFADDLSAGHGFTDVPDRWISIQNQATLDAVAEASGAPFDPRRVRANVLVEGWPAWHEESLVGERLALGDVEIEIAEVINRCRAIDVDPETSERDREAVRTLMGMRGAPSLGLYARIVTDGSIKTGDTVRVLQSAS